jgi:hypothetical protein
MSTATKATSARARAMIAANIIKRGYHLGRSFDDCFEMGDGNEVFMILARKAQNDWYLAARLARIFPERAGEVGLTAEKVAELFREATRNAKITYSR